MLEVKFGVIVRTRHPVGAIIQRTFGIRWTVPVSLLEDLTALIVYINLVIFICACDSHRACPDTRHQSIGIHTPTILTSVIRVTVPVAFSREFPRAGFKSRADDIKRLITHDCTLLIKAFNSTNCRAMALYLRTTASIRPRAARASSSSRSSVSMYPSGSATGAGPAPRGWLREGTGGSTW